MFKVETPDGPRYMVQLVGPRSYRYKGMMITRGGTLTVKKRTRDYLVKTTGFFADFDPTPAEPIDVVNPPQFGDDYGPKVDEYDFDMVANPPLSQEEAIALAAKSGAEVDQTGKPVASDDPEGTEKGDLTAADLPTVPAKGGKSAAPKKPVPATKAGADNPVNMKATAAQTVG
jgi:hypothetical protein